jgi:hypothetical protein
VSGDVIKIGIITDMSVYSDIDGPAASSHRWPSPDAALTQEDDWSLRRPPEQARRRAAKAREWFDNHASTC